MPAVLLQELSDEVFSKVERLFLLGLRAADPVRRARFFSLYHKHIAAGLFERLQFIICVQVRGGGVVHRWPCCCTVCCNQQPDQTTEERPQLAERVHVCRNM